ncbi:hypothetical protein HGM15179_018918 [Zosterops borbonicus]|uniref:Uncharacterized protein n=1 Tax=Zosterops borbonicus TaxID=364589 RepID=A0A8K1D943_9PASS|nr:hypothetical protein HGM15179_018918 [Zosterops borbonicus]
MALKMEVLLAKAGPIRNYGNVSVITYLGRNQKKGGDTVFIPDREEEEVKTCEGNNIQTPSSSSFPSSKPHIEDSHAHEDMCGDAAREQNWEYCSAHDRNGNVSIGAFTAGYCPDNSEYDEGDPFEPEPIDPTKDPDLYPPDPDLNDTWVHLKQQERGIWTLPKELRHRSYT